MKHEEVEKLAEGFKGVPLKPKSCPSCGLILREEVKVFPSRITPYFITRPCQCVARRN